jgi:acetyltransferase-like isoleucine patch superfamily enzyme
MIELFCDESKRPQALAVLGENNRIFIDEGCDVSELSIHMEGTDNFLRISKNCVVKGLIHMKGKRLRVKIGQNTTIEKTYIHCCEQSSILIGKDCMFAHETEFRTSDAHSIIDLETRRRINLPANIHIGAGVWLGSRCQIHKGARIAPNNIVGAMSFVNKQFDEPNTIIAGIPARVIKRGVTWDRSRKHEYTPEEMEYKQSRNKKWPPV